MREKTIICVLLIISFGVLLITCLYKDNRDIIEEEITSTSINTIETTKATKKTTKTTHKTTIKTKNKRVVSGTKEEYLIFAKNYGKLNDTQLTCLDNLWIKESGWNPNSVNKSSGACGIPQAYPCSKIKNSKGSNNWKAQIEWGIDYINYRYKNPCSAWNHFKNKGWY